MSNYSEMNEAVLAFKHHSRGKQLAQHLAWQDACFSSREPGLESQFPFPADALSGSTWAPDTDAGGLDAVPHSRLQAGPPWVLWVFGK